MQNKKHRPHVRHCSVSVDRSILTGLVRLVDQLTVHTANTVTKVSRMQPIFDLTIAVIHLSVNSIVFEDCHIKACLEFDRTKGWRQLLQLFPCRFIIRHEKLAECGLMFPSANLTNSYKNTNGSVFCMQGECIQQKVLVVTEQFNLALKSVEFFLTFRVKEHQIRQTDWFTLFERLLWLSCCRLTMTNWDTCFIQPAVNTWHSRR